MKRLKRLTGMRLFEALVCLIGQEHTIKLYKSVAEFSTSIYVPEFGKLLYTKRELKIYEEHNKMIKAGSRLHTIPTLSRKFELDPRRIRKIIRKINRISGKNGQLLKAEGNLIDGESCGIRDINQMISSIGLRRTLRIYKKYQGKILYFQSLKRLFIESRNEMIFKDYLWLRKSKNVTDHKIHQYIGKRYRLHWMSIRKVVKRTEKNSGIHKNRCKDESSVPSLVGRPVQQHLSCKDE